MDSPESTTPTSPETLPDSTTHEDSTTEDSNCTTAATMRLVSSQPSAGATMPPGTPNTTSSNHILMVDDYFIRKILSQLCPNSDHFGKKSVSSYYREQYMKSFRDGDAERSPKLERILTADQITCDDELLVYWQVSPGGEQDPPIDSWLQNRDPVTAYCDLAELLLAWCQHFQSKPPAAADTSSFSHIFGERNCSSSSIDRLAFDVRTYLWLSTGNHVLGPEAEDGDASGKPETHADTFTLFCSILTHLVHLLYESAEVECRVKFFHIFNKLFAKANMDSSETTNYVRCMKHLNHVIASLASHELNHQTPSDRDVTQSPTADRYESRDVKTPTTGTGTGTSTSTSSPEMTLTEPPMIDCNDDFGPNGPIGSVLSSHGRSHSTNSSGPSSGVGSLDSHPSPTPTSLFRDIFSVKSPTPHSTLLHSPSVLGESSDLASSPAHFNSPMDNSDDNSLPALFSHCQLNELAEMNEIPKLIPPTSISGGSNQFGGFGFDSLDSSLFGSSTKPSGSASFNSGAPRGTDFFPSVEDATSGGGSGFFSDLNLSSFLPLEETNSSVDSSSELAFASAAANSALMKNYSALSSVDSNPLSNQCFTITMDSSAEKHHQLKGMLASQQSEEAYLRAMYSPHGAAMASGPQGQTSVDQQSSQTVDSVPLCDRILLYRFIISQLLYDGHRSIANQLSNAERIKGDGSLLSPNDRLHALVSIAIRREIDRLSINNADFNRSNSTGSAVSPFYDQSPQPSPQQQLFASPRLMSDSEAHVSNNKAMFDRSPSHQPMAYPTSPLSMFANNQASPTPISNNSALDYVADSANSDLYNNPNEFYYGRNSAEILTNSHQSSPAPSVMFSKSNELTANPAKRPSTRNNSSKLFDPPNDFVFNEAGLKNISQLVKLSAGDGGHANSTSPLLSNGSMAFGRPASSMAMTPMSGGASSNGPGSHHLSPLTIQTGKAGSAGASHTTGNGKNHQIMQICSKFGSLGSSTNQFSSPHGFCLGLNDEIVIADTNNHRICVYDKNGTFKHSFGSAGKDEGQLWYPRKITMISTSYIRGTTQNPYYVICDRGMERSRMQIFTRNGNFVRKIPIRYIDIVAGIAVNKYGHIIAVDSVSPTIYVISDNGSLIEWYDCSDYMREPSDIAIFDNEYYICDFKGHCVVVLSSTGNYLRKIGMEGLTSFPNGIDISPNGDIFVGDSHGNRFHVVIFNRDGQLISEHECPYVKVSRCCGLKLTKDNCIVTLAKNNHHVLVLNSNYAAH